MGPIWGRAHTDGGNVHSEPSPFKFYNWVCMAYSNATPTTGGSKFTTTLSRDMWLQHLLYTPPYPSQTTCTFRIAGKFGGEFSLVDWRTEPTPPN